MKTKICSNPKCKKEKPISEFYKDKKSLDGYQSQCKECVLIIRKKHYEENKEKQLKYNKKYREENKEEVTRIQRKWAKKNFKRVKENQSKWYKENRERLLKIRKKYYKENKEYSKKYRKNNKTQIAKYQKEYRKNNKEYFKEHSRKYCLNRKCVDKNFKILINLRSRIYQALKNKTKSLPTIFLIGCEIDYLMYHLQEQFTKGMTWDNYGRGDKGKKEWHMDHIKPCAKFDLSKPEEQRDCFHYTNLQPLWAIDNIKKGSKYNEY